MRRPTSEAPPVPAPGGERGGVDPRADGPRSLAEYLAAQRHRWETVDIGVVTALNQVWRELLAGDLRQLGAAAQSYWGWVHHCPEWGRLRDEVRQSARDGAFEVRATGHAGLIGEWNAAVDGEFHRASAAVPSPTLPQPARGWALLGFLLRKLNSEGEPRWHDVWRQFHPDKAIPSSERARRFLQDELQPLHDALVAHVTSLVGEHGATKTKKSKTWLPPPKRQDAHRRWEQIDAAIRKVCATQPDAYAVWGGMGRLTKAVKRELPMEPGDAGSTDEDWLRRQVGTAYRHYHPRTGDDT